MKIHTGDLVQVISGKDKGKKGKVLKVFLKLNKVVVEGVCKVKRHVKPGVIDKEGGIIEMEKPIDVSNVMFFDTKLNRPVRLTHKVIDNKKYRVSRKSGEVIEKTNEK